ncbi:hypothetical protein RGU44_17590 [Pseudomonas sp. 5C2]|jgi:hypothetical protein|uniref:hypothetical protein n=1 Tax=Pseudomonas sp. 5C2 TaxID=3048588 RepID=UPI002AB3BB5A|nr:hypothetical protein [Pseudomonas sp. 5C2]MDY7566839.1 hypothetical protein [Pseudomonas sp. 5C2]MEB0243860.1 hypothetical protein [Pseudomonas sp. 5C2]
MLSCQEKIELQILERFGPLVTLEQLAELLHRQPGGLAWSLSQEGEFSGAINATRVKLGRRSYFRTSELAGIIANG